MRREFWKNQGKTEILDDDFLTNLEKEIQKRYPNNTSVNVNDEDFKNKKQNVEFLEDTIELLIDDDIANKFANNEDKNVKLNEKNDDLLSSFYEVVETLDEDSKGFIEEYRADVDSEAKVVDSFVEDSLAIDDEDMIESATKVGFDEEIEIDSKSRSLDDTIELLNDKFEELNKVSRNLDDTIEFLKSDISFLRNYSNDDVEILDEEIEDFEDPSESVESTTERLDITRRLEPIQVKKKITPKKRPWIILLTICTIVIILLSYRTVIWYMDSRKTNQQINDIVQATHVKETMTNQNNTVENGIITNTDDVPSNFLDVNFSDLIKQNSDVKGWIKVNNTKINYPFVQTKDNDFYLKHSFDKSKNSAGWVFADFRNDFENLHQNTILYAHGRLDNTMFGSLKQVVEKEWYENEDNKILQISSLKTNYLWEVFSVYTIEPETYYITPYFTNDNDYQKFLDTLSNRSVYDFDVALTIEDKILTLSSCYNDELRVVLHAKLVNTMIK